MKKIITSILFLVFVSGCSSNREYYDDRSFAWNVTWQVEADSKLRDVKAPDEQVVYDRSVAGHLVDTFVLSPNFFASFGLSILSDRTYPFDRTQLILPVNLDNGDEEVIIGLLVDALKKQAPDAELFDFDNGMVAYDFWERSERCTAYLTKGLESAIIAKRAKLVKWKREYLERNTCKHRFIIKVYDDVNEDVFPGKKGYKNVMVTSEGFIRMPALFKEFPESYLFWPQSKSLPPLVLQKDTAYLYFKPKEEKEKFGVPINSLPNSEWLIKSIR